MKLIANVCNVNKQPSLEEGSMRYQTTDEDCNSTDTRKSSHCNRCLQLMKVILYLELILFVGWLGCLFISNYYQDHDNNGMDKPSGTSKWSRDPDIPNSVIDSNVVTPDEIKWPPEQDDTKTTTVKSQTQSQPSNEKKIPIDQSEMTTATNVIKPDNTDVESMLLSRWLESLAMRKNSWDESSSKSTSFESKFDSDTSSNEKTAFDANSDRASSDENHFETINKDDKIDLDFLLTLPLWHNVVFTSDYLDEIVRSDEDLLQADGIANGTFGVVNPDSMEHHRARKVRSTAEQDEDSSSSSSSEEATTKHSKPHHSHSEDSDEEECPTILDDDGNVIDEPKDLVSYIGKNWFRWLDEADIPECEEPEVVKTVTVDRCGKFDIECGIEEKSNKHGRHQRDIENAEENNAMATHCKELVEAQRKDFEVWRAKLVTGESSDLAVQNIYQHITKHLFALTIKEIVGRTTGKQHKTDTEWYTVMIAMRNNISESIDSKYQDLLIDSTKLTLEMAMDLGKIIKTAVDIYLDCHNVLLAAPQYKILMMLIERERCFQSAERIIAMKDRLAAEIVPGESTNLDVTMVRQIFKAHVMLLIIRMAEDEIQDDASVHTGPVDVSDKQWTSYMLGLKQEIVKFVEDPNLRKQLEDSVSPTQEQTNQLREIMVYYLRQHVQCSMLTLFGIIGQYKNMAVHSIRSARSTDSKWETGYIGTLKIYKNEKSSRSRRAVWTVKPTPIVVTCKLEDDDIQFGEERQERLDRYNELVALSSVDVREPFLNAIEERLNGTSPAGNADAGPTPLYMRYLQAADVFTGNTSSSLRDEGYKLLRDIVLELKFLDDNETAFEGYDMDTLMANWTGCLMHIPDNYTAETIFMAAIKAGEAINLHYSAVEEGKNCGDEFTPVYGTFTYVGEQPEKSIVRRWRHIFREIIRLYFRMNNPEALPKLQCTSDEKKSETGKRHVEMGTNRLAKRSIQHPIRRSAVAVTCTLGDDDIQFDQERQERLDRYDQIVALRSVDVWESILNIIQEKLNVLSPAENSEETPKPIYMGYMNAFDVFMGNASPSLRNEGYKLLRDIVLESKFLADNETALEDMRLLRANWTVGCLIHISDNYTAETILMAVIKAGEAMNLHYSAVEEGKNCGDEFTPAYGTFTYVGEQPEKSMVRRWRHIFGEIIRLYFKINNPEVLPELQCTSNEQKSQTEKRHVETGTNRLGKRSIGHPIRRSASVVTCTLKDDDIQYGQERQERLDRRNQIVAFNTSDVRHNFLNAIEEKLNGTSPAEYSDKDPTPVYMPYMKAADVFIGNSSGSLRREGYDLIRDIFMEAMYLDENETAFEGYNVTAAMLNWMGCLNQIQDNYTAETVLMAVIKIGEAIDLHYSGIEGEKNCADEFTPVYGTFTYAGEQPEKSVIRRWRHIFGEMVKLYFKIHNPDALPKVTCASDGEKSQTEKTHTESAIPRFGKRSIGYPFRKSDNTVNIDEKDFGNEDNAPLIKADPDIDTKSQNFHLPQNSFFDKMEALSSHIDRLHELYQKYNELNDDYVSKEFPDEMPSNYEY